MPERVWRTSRRPAIASAQASASKRGCVDASQDEPPTNRRGLNKSGDAENKTRAPAEAADHDAMEVDDKTQSSDGDEDEEEEESGAAADDEDEEEEESGAPAEDAAAANASEEGSGDSSDAETQKTSDPDCGQCFLKILPGQKRDKKTIAHKACALAYKATGHALKKTPQVAETI